MSPGSRIGLLSLSSTFNPVQVPNISSCSAKMTVLRYNCRSNCQQLSDTRMCSRPLFSFFVAVGPQSDHLALDRDASIASFVSPPVWTFYNSTQLSMKVGITLLSSCAFPSSYEIQSMSSLSSSSRLFPLVQLHYYT